MKPGSYKASLSLGNAVSSAPSGLGIAKAAGPILDFVQDAQYADVFRFDSAKNKKLPYFLLRRRKSSAAGIRGRGSS